MDLTFKTHQSGLVTGMKILVNSTIRGINQYYRIVRVAAKAISPNSLEFTINLLASGKVTFTDIMVGLLGKR
jgi:hypothetical protein